MLHGSGPFDASFPVNPSAGPSSDVPAGVLPEPPPEAHRYIEIIESPQETMAFRWDLHDLANHLGQTLQGAEDDFRLEQAVYGLDSLDEIKLHQLLVRGLSRWYTVQREVLYPSAPAKKRSHRARCDLVVTPHGRPLRPGDGPDLFTPADACSAEEALWLEVKAAYQYRDVATRHSGYATQWKTGLVEDIRKMQGDPRIAEAGVLLVVFNESEEILAKDLELFEDHLTNQGLSPAGTRGGIGGVAGTPETFAAARHVRSVRITERMGHRLATVALWPIVQRPAV